MVTCQSQTKRLTLNFKSYLRKILATSHLMNISTLLWKQLHQKTQVDWRQECREKSIAEALESEDTVLINDSDDEIAVDEQDFRKVIASDALDSLDVAKDNSWR